MSEPIVFKCEESLWRLLESGEKPFDMRRWDLSDDRIYRLAWGHGGRAIRAGSVIESGRLRYDERLDGAWAPVEKQVSFVNKADGRLLIFEYRGLEFAHWAPGWCFLILGRKLTGGVPVEG